MEALLSSPTPSSQTHTADLNRELSDLRIIRDLLKRADRAIRSAKRLASEYQLEKQLRDNSDHQHFNLEQGLSGVRSASNLDDGDRN